MKSRFDRLKKEIAAKIARRDAEQPPLLEPEPEPPPPQPRPDVHRLRFGMSDQELPPIRPPDFHHLMQHAKYRIDLRERSSKLTHSARRMVSPQAFRLYAHLHLTALICAHRRNYHSKTSQITFFCPQDTVMDQLGIKSRTTIGKYRRELEAAGLLKSDYQQTTVDTERYRTGMLWAVKVFPERAAKTRLSYDDYKHTYRDMESDLESGRTAFNLRNGHTQRDPSGAHIEFDLILYWALSDFRALSPSSVYVHSAQQPQIETVLDVPFMPWQDRRATVSLAVKSVQTAFNDHNEVSQKFLFKLMWNLLRLSDEGQDYFRAVYDVLKRVHVDMLEGFTTTPGNLFVYRLKQLPFWDEVHRASGSVAPPAKPK